MAPVLLVIAKRLAVPLGGLLWRALGGVVLERVLLYGLFWTSQRWAAMTPWTLDDEMVWQAIITYYGGEASVPQSLSDYRTRRAGTGLSAAVLNEVPVEDAGRVGSGASLGDDAARPKQAGPAELR